MKTEKLFKNFHEKSQAEIAELVRNFVEEDFFKTFPQWKNKISILITGSVASGFYDAKSDIDLNFIFPDEKSWKAHKFDILSYFKGKYLEPKKKPIEVHGQNINYIGQIEKELDSWKGDRMMREFSDAIIIFDPKNKIKKLKEKYRWYQKDIYLEKINWLFAEATFLLLDRYQIGMDRISFYFMEITKLKIVRLLLASLVMANGKFPTSDKHLFEDVLKNSEIPSEIKKAFEKVLKEKNPKAVLVQLVSLRSKIEKILISKKLIINNSERYWMGFRSAMKVEIEK